MGLLEGKVAFITGVALPLEAGHMLLNGINTAPVD